jgi:hypothetical protein
MFNLFDFKYYRQYRIVKETFGDGQERFRVEYRVNSNHLVYKLSPMDWALHNWYNTIEDAQKEIEKLKQKDHDNTVISKEIINC